MVDRFGWSINILCKERNYTEIARELGIDTSNCDSYQEITDLLPKIATARYSRNQKLAQGTASPFHSFCS